MEAQQRAQLELFSFPAQQSVRVRSSKGRQRPAQRQLKPSTPPPLSHSPLIAPYQGHPPFVVTSETSREAAETMAETSGAIRNKVFDFITFCGSHGATCDEVEVALGLRHQTASARCRELVIQGRLIKRVDSVTGKSVRRPTRSSRNADVLFAA